MRARQRGAAIVLAMSVVALAALAATAMMVTQSTWSRRNELTSDHVQAQFVVRAGVDFARALLSDDRRASAVDHLGETWAQRLSPMPVDNGRLGGHIEDQQAAFNLNNLVDNGGISITQLARFRRLLTILGLPAELADALADWVDADSQPQPQGGAEDSYYLTLARPYLAANRPLIDVTELALVRGFDSNVRARLRPFVTALPRFTAVNVNTATPEVYAAIVEGLSLDAARDLIAKRERAYFRDSADFINRLPAGATVPGEVIAVSSMYFMATVQANIGTAEARGTALLARADRGWPAVVWSKLL